MSLVELIINFFLAIVNFIIGFFPILALPQSFFDSVTFATGWLAILAWALPLRTIFDIAFICIALYTFRIIYGITIWTLHFIPKVRTPQTSVIDYDYEAVKRLS